MNRFLARIALATVLGLAACSPKPAEAPKPSVEANVKLGEARQNGSTWLELGTQSGPIPSGRRSEPAHMLQWKDQLVLIDCGDGCSEQMAKAGLSIAEVQTVVISHLHFDHTGGLFAFLALRYQGAGPMAKPLTIYGPPGIKAMVQAMRQAMLEGGALYPSPLPDYTIVELNDGQSFDIGDLKTTAAANSHYGEWNGKGVKPVSLSYRFDMPGRSIVYTGDTGPSDKVEKLALGADLLVTEIMDADTAIAQIKKRYPKMPPFVLPFLKGHFNKEHMLAGPIGLMASRAGVKSVLLTHFGGDDGSEAQMDRLTAGVAANYKGPVRFVKDLERY